MKRNQPIQEIDLGKDVLAFDYSETVFLIGRSKDCHIVLDDKQISREHVRIIHKNGKWFAEKTAEENICLYNGHDFDRAELDGGDSLTVGVFTLNIENSSIGVEQPVKDKLAPEIKEEPIAQPVTESKVASKPSPQRDPDATSEISLSEITEEIQIETPVKLEQESSSEGMGVDEFNYEENSEQEAELALGLNSDSSSTGEDSFEMESESNGESDLGVETDDSASYSLENIDSAPEDESTKIMQSFARVQLELFGDTAPYDKYIIDSEKTYIGRDPTKCQIVLNDTEVSSVHAVITKNNILISIEDLNSSNGTILNGDRIKKATLNHNDEFVIGAVSFTLKVRSDFLKEENSTLMAVDENQTVEVEEVVEVEAEEGESLDALGQIVSDGPEEKSIIKRIWKDDVKRKKAIYVVVGGVLAWVMLGDETPQAPAAKPKKAVVKKVDKVITNKTTGKILSEDEKRALSARYEIGKNHYYNGRYREALEEFQKIFSIDPNFNTSLQSLISLSKEGLSKLEEQEKKRLAEQAAAEKKIKIKELIEKAAAFVKDRRVEMAQDTFNEIAKIDPENIEVTKMKMELEDWQREKSRKELEEATKKKEREDKIEKFKPGKALFIQKEWFKAIGKFEDFLKIKDMDEDLTKEASEMLKISRDEVATAVAPLVGKAKSLMEGQDLKGAYEIYQQILKIEPSNAEALDQVGEIKENLSNKARKIYREAIISESLSLFQDAKEKFQEVQQISPVDSDYYKKASEKLKHYLD